MDVRATACPWQTEQVEITGGLRRPSCSGTSFLAPPNGVHNEAWLSYESVTLPSKSKIQILIPIRLYCMARQDLQDVFLNFAYRKMCGSVER